MICGYLVIALLYRGGLFGRNRGMDRNIRFGGSYAYTLSLGEKLGVCVGSNCVYVGESCE
jgi:hypothetical protein